MRTLGIDLASQPAKTGLCVVSWRPGSAKVPELAVGAEDLALLAAHRRCDVTGIDAPFGWPAPFVDFVAATDRADGTIPEAWSAVRHDALRFRATDRHEYDRLLDTLDARGVDPRYEEWLETRRPGPATVTVAMSLDPPAAAAADPRWATTTRGTRR